MQRQLVRAAISIYPPRWRRRYGSELEQLASDAAAGAYSRLESMRLVVDLARTGIGEWFRYLGPRTRIVILALAAGLGALMLNAVQVATESHNPALPVSGQNLFTQHTYVGPGVVVVRARAPRFGAGPAGGKTTVVTVEPGPGGVTSLSGAPSSVVLNPVTRRIVSVTQHRLP